MRQGRKEVEERRGRKEVGSRERKDEGRRDDKGGNIV